MMQTGAIGSRLTETCSGGSGSCGKQYWTISKRSEARPAPEDEMSVFAGSPSEVSGGGFANWPGEAPTPPPPDPPTPPEPPRVLPPGDLAGSGVGAGVGSRVC